MMVVRRAGYMTVQEYYPNDSAACSYIRFKWSTTWKEWVRTDNFGCNTAADLASLLGVAPSIYGSNNNVYSLGTVSHYQSVRILGADFDESRGVVDFTIYGNGAGSFTARGRANASGREIEVYISSDTFYLKFPTGIAVTAIVIGASPTSASLPSGATKLTVTAYS